MDPDRRPERGHAARERLDHREPEALVLRRHDHGVRGVDPVRAPRPAATPPIVSSGTSPAASRARSKRFSGRAGSCGNRRYGPAGSSPSRARASARGIGRKRSSAIPTGSTATRRVRAGAGQVGAERARDRRRERGERQRGARDEVGAADEQVVAVERHDDGPAQRGERRQRGEAEVRVDDVERRARASGARIVAIARSSARGPGGNANTSTSTSPRRRSASTWSRTKIPRCGAASRRPHVRHDERAHRAERTFVHEFGRTSGTNTRRAVQSRAPSIASQAPPTAGGGMATTGRSRGAQALRMAGQGARGARRARRATCAGRGRSSTSA